MKKKLLAILLSLAMIAGIVPVSVLEVNATETDEVILADDVTGNTYTDDTAKDYEAYVYTVTGDDGSTYEVEVLPDGITSETVESTTYELISVDSLDDIVDGIYMIYSARFCRALLPEQSSAEGKAAFLDYAQIEDERDQGTWTNYTPTASIEVSDEDSNKNLDWEITSTGTTGSYIIKNVGTGKYLKIGSSFATTDIGETTTTIAKYSGEYESHTGSITLGQNEQYLNMHGGLTGYFGGYEKADDGGAATYLYLKNPAGITYTVEVSELQALVDAYEAENLISSNYTSDSWTVYSEALSEAETLLAQENTFSTLEEAVAFKTTLNEAKTSLEKAYNELVQLEIVTIRPMWQRTLETNNHEYNEKGDLVLDVKYITQAETVDDVVDQNYSIITWAQSAESILELTTDPSMEIWDYNKDKQYAPEIWYPNGEAKKETTKQEGVNISAATWNEHEENIGDWQSGSVRRFTGTFTWPEGYTVDDTVIYQSVNDANYKAIYDYINSDPAVKTRYGNSKVYPINDDMFVFIRKANDELTATDMDYLNHMIFWSGTSGKGVWSSTNSNADWGRETPATFNGVNALPAYYQIMPNNNDVVEADKRVQVTSNNFGFVVPENTTQTGWMEHTDGWYTMVNSDTVMSTVKKLYGVEDLSNQEMIIDIFCFDNSSSGGMDEIELIFQKTPETATSVQVNYYLDSVMTDNLLGSTVMTNVEDDTQITLNAGTNVNELDHFRFAAATKAGTVVSNGVQQEPVPYVVDINKEDNIINVVYTSNDANDRVYYFYDFGVENEYIYTPKDEAVLNKDYQITDADILNDSIDVNVSSDKKYVILKYTPSHSRGEVAVGTLNLTFTDANDSSVSYGTEVKPIVIAPASNVFYEENFIKQSTNTDIPDWIKPLNNSIPAVEDNETTVFGYTKSYETSTGHSGVLTAVVNSTDAFTENLEFQFGGTGFDLIGSCGPNTGTIAVRVVNSAGVGVKSYLVDTSYTDTTGVVTAGTTINQVPLLQAKDLPEDTYTVTIRGAYIVYNSGASTYSLDSVGSSSGRDTISDIYDLFYGVGMTEDDIDSVEYINMGKLMGASTFAVAEDEVETAQVTATPEDMMIVIDGFRSYRATDYNKYPQKERGVVYQNILDCVSNGFAGYIENKEDNTYQVNEYEISGGPQNEIYLTSNNNKNTGLVIGQTNSISKQISLRSVDGKPVTVKVNGGAGQTNGKTIPLQHTTEMYYEVSANDAGFIVIQVESGFLGIGNLKLTSGNAEQQAVMPTALTEEDYALVATTMRMYAAAPPEEEISVFTPEKFEVSTIVKNKKFTVTVATSDDVEYITVNGEIVSKAKANRGSDEKTFTYKGKVNKGEVVELEIVAYNSDKLASEAKLLVVEKPSEDNKKPGKDNSKKPSKENSKKPGKDNKGGKK